jgi:hypothetical protein
MLYRIEQIDTLVQVLAVLSAGQPRTDIRVDSVGIIGVTRRGPQTCHARRTDRSPHARLEVQVPNRNCGPSPARESVMVSIEAAAAQKRNACKNDLPTLMGRDTGGQAFSFGRLPSLRHRPLCVQNHKFWRDEDVGHGGAGDGDATLCDRIGRSRCRVYCFA